MNFDLFTYLSSLGFFYIYSRLTLHYAPFALDYFLHENIEFCKTIEKPRILYHLTGLLFMHLMFFYNIKNKSELIFLDLMLYAIYILGFYFCIITWSNKFQSTFKKEHFPSSKNSPSNFNLSASIEHLHKLFNEMVRYDLIDEQTTTRQDFINVMIRDWHSHDSKIIMKFDGPSCREFYEYFIKTFPENTITLKNFFITSEKICRPDGKKYNYNTLKNSPFRTPVSKKSQVIQSIFDNLI